MKKRHVSLGVDLGKTGAMVLLAPGMPPIYWDLIMDADGLVKSPWLCGLLKAQVNWVCPSSELGLVYEDLQVRPAFAGGTSASSQTALMLQRGRLEACAAIAGVDFRAVTPQAWQKAFGLTGKKTAGMLRQARETALRLHPSADHWITLAKHHNRVDALLIAHYAQMERESTGSTAALVGALS